MLTISQTAHTPAQFPLPSRLSQNTQTHTHLHTIHLHTQSHKQITHDTRSHLSSSRTNTHKILQNRPSNSSFKITTIHAQATGSPAPSSLDSRSSTTAVCLQLASSPLATAILSPAVSLSSCSLFSLASMRWLFVRWVLERLSSKCDVLRKLLGSEFLYRFSYLLFEAWRRGAFSCSASNSFLIFSKS